MEKLGYFANGLFSQADRMFNESIVKQIRENVPELEIYLPQENMGINDKNAYADSLTIFDGDNNHLDEADILIAVIDGSEIDSGVACEIGRFGVTCELAVNIFGEAAIGRKIYALYTDVRQQGRDNEKKIQALIDDGVENQFAYKNLYVVGAIKKFGKIFTNVEDLIEELKKECA